MRDFFVIHSVTVTTAIMVMLLVLGLLAYVLNDHTSKWVQLGTALVAGSVFALASVLLQLGAEKATFETTVAVSSDLTGFDSLGRSLENLNLAGKTLDYADLQDSNLTGATLASATMADANLGDAVLEEADMRYASLLRTNLINASLGNADLTGTKFVYTYLDDAELDGAKVHRNTCWTLGEGLMRVTAEQVSTMGLRSVDAEYATLGHVCTPGDASEDGTSSATQFICVDGSVVSETGTNGNEVARLCGDR